MKKFTKRSLAWLASLMLFISLLTGLVVVPVEAATVNYVYSGNYIYNWGVRGITATFLSPNAEAFYDDNSVTYQQLASLSGSSSVGSVPDSALFQELHELMYDNLTSPTSYDATKNLFQYTDCQNSALTSDQISSFYSGVGIGPAWNSSEWNREHTWPNSKSNGGSSSNTQRETDIMMLRPTSVSENSSRSNTAYGESSGYYHPNEESGGTYDLRGDVSRIVLYVYTCWGGSDQHDGALNYMWGSSGVIESKEILLQWMEEDPVDTWELGRNDSVESITGTRNVFVDYPELAFLLFDEEVPADYDSPSGAGASAGYTITADTNNANYGAVTVQGSTVTATPNTGYAVSGYTILSGTATVTRNGNVFTVVPSSDVSIRINFAKRSQSTVQFAHADGTVTSQTAYMGDAITLPAHSGTVQSGYTFLGWVEDKVEETTTVPTYLKAGAAYTVAADAVLYALYSRTEQDGDSGNGNGNVFELYSGTLTEGDYIIVYNDGAMVAQKSDANRLNVAAVTDTDGAIENPDSDIVWYIAPSGDYWTLYNTSVGAYAGGNGTKNKGVLLTSLTDYGKWTVTGDGTYEFVNVGNKSAGVNANLRRNGDYGFACYSTSTGGSLTLYKRSAVTTYYFSADTEVARHEYDNACDPDCNICGEVRVPADHEYDNACDADCNECDAEREVGEHVYDNACDADCNECGATRTVSSNYVESVTTPATCGADGVKTYTCSVCGDSYTEVIPATGLHTYDNACDASCNVCGGTRTPSDHVYTADCDTLCDVCGEVRTVTAGGETIITFDADKTQRVEFSTAKQVWTNGNLTVTNNKTSSSSNVADYSNPVRFYKGSEIIIAYPGMTSLVIDASDISSSYLWKATLDAAGLTYTVSEQVYTITFAEPVDSITLTAANQVRANSITAIGAGAEHEYDNDCDADCNECGTEREAGHSYTNACDVDCSVCGEVREAGDHVYDNDTDTDCNECGEVREVPVKIVYGDANGDGSVNARDAALLQQYVAGWDVTLDEASADANGDGSVNARDAALLQQYVAGWDVTLG